MGTLTAFLLFGLLYVRPPIDGPVPAVEIRYQGPFNRLACFQEAAGWGLNVMVWDEKYDDQLGGYCVVQCEVARFAGRYPHCHLYLIGVGGTDINYP